MVPVEIVTGGMWVTAVATLAKVAELGEKHDVVFVLENLNTEVDHPGTPFARAADTLALVRGVGSPHLRMNLDLYHAQIGEGNLAELLRRAAPYLGEVQIADVPGRCEPLTGEVRWDYLARVLAEVGYDGVVALEAWASGPGVDGRTWPWTGSARRSTPEPHSLTSTGPLWTGRPPPVLAGRDAKVESTTGRYPSR